MHSDVSIGSFSILVFTCPRHLNRSTAVASCRHPQEVIRVDRSAQVLTKFALLDAAE